MKTEKNTTWSSFWHENTPLGAQPQHCSMDSTTSAGAAGQCWAASGLMILKVHHFLWDKSCGKFKNNLKPI